MAIEHKENCLFVSCDDKAKVDYGEPGTALSTGVRGKKSLIPINSTLGALDISTATRTAPGQSYVNIVERMMSILNTGYQNVALEREPSPSDYPIKKCKNLEDLHKHPDIKNDWLKSVQNVIDVLDKWTNRLFLKDEPFMSLFCSAC